MRKVLMLTALIAMIATGAMAAKLPSKSAPAFMSYNHDMGRSLTEGFEGAFPPAGWGQVITNPAYTWYQDVSAFEGSYAARIGWQAGSPQDEVLSFDYTVEAGDDLTFATMGSPYWSVNGNFTVEVDGLVVFDYNAENLGNSFLWEEYTVDLEPYAGALVNIAFRYAGDDGADHHLDAVQIGEYTPPPPPPPVSFCEMLEEVEGTGMFSGDTCDGVNLVESLGCEVYTEAGLEDYYEIEMPAGASFTAEVLYASGYDGALWVVGECEAEGGAFTCLAYADDTVQTDPIYESVTYTNVSGSAMTVYLVIDGWGTGTCGLYDLDFQASGGAVANEDVDMSTLKTMFR